MSNAKKKRRIFNQDDIDLILSEYAKDPNLSHVAEKLGLQISTIHYHVTKAKAKDQTPGNISEILKSIQADIMELKEILLKPSQTKKESLVKPSQIIIEPSNDEEIQTVKRNGKIWIKSNEACKGVFKNDGSNCSDHTIKLAYTNWNKQTNQNKEGNFSYGYILEDLLEALKYANEAKDKKYHLDFSKLEEMSLHKLS